MNKHLKGAIIILADIAGKTALKQTLSAMERQQINISALAKGMYIVHIIKTTGAETQKLLKE